jgi:hypothetical protein
MLSEGGGTGADAGGARWTALLKRRLCCMQASLIEMQLVAAVFRRAFISWFAGQVSLSDSWYELWQLTQFVEHGRPGV